MHNINRQFFEYIFPSMEAINAKPNVPYDTNNVIFKNIVCFGYQGSGKTLTVNNIVAEAVKLYGEDNVNAVISENGDLDLLIKCGLTDKPVNILFADNITLRKLSRDTLMQYFRIRHLYRERFHKSNGYILSFLGLHRFHSIPVEIRTNMDGIIIKDSSMNPYDRRLLKSFIGETLLKMLDELSMYKTVRPDLKDISVFYARGIVGIIQLSLSSKYYLHPVDHFDVIRNRWSINGT